MIDTDDLSDQEALLIALAIKFTEDGIPTRQAKAQAAAVLEAFMDDPNLPDAFDFLVDTLH